MSSIPNALIFLGDKSNIPNDFFFFKKVQFHYFGINFFPLLARETPNSHQFSQ